MDIVEWIRSINVVDIVIILFLAGMFILGWIQGTIRRLVGIASIVFSFFLALQLNAFWLGGFLAENWEQYPPEYSVMLGYLIVFVAASVAFSLVIQGTYKKAEIFAAHPIVDEILGGILGVVQGFLILMFLVIILDQYFLYTNIPKDPDELPLLREFWTAIESSQFGVFLHEQVIPVFISLTAFLIPDSIEALYDIE